MDLNKQNPKGKNTKVAMKDVEVRNHQVSTGVLEAGGNIWM